MEQMFEIVLISLCAIPLIQDLRTRTISLWPLIAIFVCTVNLAMANKGFYDTSMDFGINIGILIFQGLCLKAWFSLRERKLAGITDRYIGLGDIAFFISLAPLFAPVNFVLFVLVCSVVAIVVHLLTALWKHSPSRDIPFASALAFCAMIVLLGQMIFPHFQASNPNWIFEWYG